ncbi:low molecular weight protein-tyrosine-phosphatase [Fulvivirga sedimenti]|uniref:protein-tyrosine-phosphatase n=1 Tax=Fulvivirga sedimenti TaxID=2879465 RepID=A0A9X1HVV8_9BACT|nr:low molecular weight protein-tyrosine-phosphatase [Fulvivirga sedimenti]MCA6078008.1 low molecular weight phosphotyrosine protein phosphatase [Fulvivirga sedimenti]
MINVLFVCLGNICRSPLAEGLFRKKVLERGWDSFIHIDSSGTGDYHIGEMPDHRTRENAKNNGLILESRARQFSYEDFGNFDYIIPMDASNKTNIHRLDPDEKFRDKIILMRMFDPLEKGADVPDPYFGGAQGFQNVFEILDRSTNQFLDWLAERHSFEG